MADEDILLQLQLNAQSALDKLDEFNKRVAGIKAEITRLQVQTEDSFASIGEAMKRANPKIDNKALITAIRELSNEEKQAANARIKNLQESERMTAAYRDRITEVADRIRQISKLKDLSPAQSGREMVRQGEATQQETKDALAEIARMERDAINLIKARGRAQVENDMAIRASARETAQEQNQIRAVTAQSVRMQQEAAREYAATERDLANQQRMHWGNASEAAIAYRQRITDIATELRRIAETQRMTVQEAGRGMTLSGNATGQEVTDALKLIQQQEGPVVSTLANIGTAFRYVFGTVIGIQAIQVLRDFVAWMGKATAASIEFSQAQIRLEVAVRSLQRSGINTSIQEWIDVVSDLRSEYSFLSKQELTMAATQTTLMTREFGFTTAQMKETIKTAILLSQVTGKDLQEEIRGLTYAIGSGYFESLQKAGIQISRTIVAQEAMRRGFGNNYTALDDNIRAMLTYQIVLRNLQSMRQDENALLSDTTRQVSILSASWNDFMAEIGKIGELVTSSFATMANVIGVVERLTDTVKGLEIILNNFFYNISAPLVIAGTTAEWMWNNISGKPQNIATLRKNVAEAMAALASVIDKKLGLERGQSLDDAQINEAAQYEKSMEKFNSVVRDTKNAIDKEIEESNKQIANAERDLYSDLARLQEEYSDNSLKAWEDYLQSRQDLVLKYNRRLADIEMKYQRSLADENSSYRYKINEENYKSQDEEAKAREKHRQKQLDDEAKFQEKMLQLREKFIFDLEDAVRARDAASVMRLTRQYNLQKSQMLRERELEKKQSERDFEEELREIRDRKAQRLAELAREHAERLRQIELERQRERQDAATAFQRDMMDLTKEYEQKLAALKKALDDQIAERQAKHAETIALINNQTTEKIAILAAGFAMEANLTAAGAEAVYKILNSYYGPNGYLDNMYSYTIRKMQQVAAESARLGTLTSSGAPKSNPTSSGRVIKNPGGGLPIPSPYKKAEGGSIIATKPTWVLFGEGGPEIGSFTPLGRNGSTVNMIEGSIPAGMGRSSSNNNGKAMVEVLLSPGLEGRIIENTLGQVADVVLTVARQ